MILSVTLNACVDHATFVKELRVGDTNRVLRTETDAGGKGVNLSRVTSELGAESQATGFLGGDAGEFVKTVLEHQGVGCPFVWTQGKTRINFSVEDETGGPPTTLNAPGPTITADEWGALLAWCAHLGSSRPAVAMGGSIPPGVPTEAFEVLVSLFREKGCFVSLDADGEPMRQGVRAKPDLIKPNVAEASRLLDRDLPDLPARVRAAHDLRALGIGTVLLSMGAEGALLATGNGVWIGVPPRVDVRSTIGSGDSLLAGYLVGRERGLPSGEALALGTACGAATATTDGSEIARRPEVERLLPLVTVEKLA
ncbi:MAG: 1-phosphofructokinase family hexose kinase [Fimbriimonadaceae bacterium]|nr:1-phosphofructokinase family hexose kinase [Fimbriimonadaceae bacterium]